MHYYRAMMLANKEIDRAVASFITQCQASNSGHTSISHIVLQVTSGHEVGALSVKKRIEMHVSARPDILRLVGDKLEYIAQ